MEWERSEGRAERWVRESEMATVSDRRPGAESSTGGARAPWRRSRSRPRATMLDSRPETGTATDIPRQE
jgi:hypothetical protein